MPQPFPTIFGGLSAGIQAGQKMGLMQEEQKLKKEEMVQKKEADKRKELSSQISTGLAMASNPNVPKSMKLTAFNSATSAYNDLYGNKDGTGIPPMTEWTDEFGKIAQKASKILNDSKIPAGDKPKMILGLIEDESSNAAVQPFFTQAQKESEEKIKGQQAEVKMQAKPILEKIKKGGIQSLSDEEKTKFAEWESNPHARVAVAAAADELDKRGWPEREPEAAAEWEARKTGIQLGKEKELAGYKQGLETKKSIKPNVALDKIASLKKGIATLQSSGEIDPALAKAFPQIAAFSGMLNKKKDPKLVQDAVNAANQAISYYQQFAPQGSAMSTTSQYKTAEEVKDAFSKGTIQKNEALKVLREQFGME